MVLHAHTEETETPQWAGKTKNSREVQASHRQGHGSLYRRTAARDFNGILGIYRCSETKEAQRASKFHAVGDRYEVDCEVNGDRFVHMIRNHLIPDIQRKLLGYDCVRSNGRCESACKSLG